MKTRKILAVIWVVLALAANVFSQNIGVAINSNGAAPNSCAIFDVSSVTKGFLPPRMTNAQKTAIASPATGLIVWCTNCGSSGELQIFNGTIWTTTIGGAASGVTPGAPTIGTATAGNAQATVAFTAPASNGGSAITSYTATSSPGGLTGTLSQAGSGSITITGLTFGTAYTFTVTATTASGKGSPSAPSNSVIPFGVPGAPTIGTATAGNAQATVTFTAPASNGGSAITSYTATSSPGGFTGTLSQAGSGTITITGLTNGTAYTFTVKANNAAGAGTASVESNSVTPIAPTVTDVSGNTYETVTIGTKTWMAKNLNTTKYNDGTIIPNLSSKLAWSAATSGAYCDYDNNWFNGTTYGKLYNWYVVDNNAATKVASNGGKNICPTGWHVPTAPEWKDLFRTIGSSAEAGGRAKETGTTHWTTPNTGATNSVGFTALPGGNRFYNGAFSGIGLIGTWWATWEWNKTDAYYYYLEYSSSSEGEFNYSKNFGCSVRCLKD
jgi:uncharacterized protein (TIGR02145 family)